jgi:hypothetical protein
MSTIDKIEAKIVALGKIYANFHLLSVCCSFESFQRLKIAQQQQ